MIQAENTGATSSHDLLLGGIFPHPKQAALQPMKYDQTAYVAKQPDARGHVTYTADENTTWQKLISRQLPIVNEHACDEYLLGLEKLALPHDRVPQCYEITATLEAATGWGVEPVPALIPFERFFWLLAHKRFPAATFIGVLTRWTILRSQTFFMKFLAIAHC